jgi:hypothetical protein
MREFEVVLEVLLTILHLAQVIQVLIILLENRHQIIGLLRQFITVYLKRKHLFLLDESDHHADTGQILEVELSYSVLPSECTTAGQLEILLKHTCPELFDWIHVEGELTHFL